MVHLVADPEKYVRMLREGFFFARSVCGKVPTRSELATDIRYVQCPECLDRAGVSRSVSSAIPSPLLAHPASLQVSETPFLSEGSEVSELDLEGLEGVEGGSGGQATGSPSGDDLEFEDIPGFSDSKSWFTQPSSPSIPAREAPPEAKVDFSQALSLLVPEGAAVLVEWREWLELEGAKYLVPEDLEFVQTIGTMSEMVGAPRLPQRIALLLSRVFSKIPAPLDAEGNRVLPEKKPE
jgi:hypothetical protein